MLQTVQKVRMVLAHKKGYRQVIATFWLQGKNEQKYGGWDWEEAYLIG